MLLALFDDMTQATTQEVERLLPLVSPQRSDEALKYRHTFGQYACLKSYDMLHRLLTDNGLIPDDASLTFDRGEHGKPTLHDYPGIHFNISHCHRAIAVVVDSRPVGIDVERFTTPDDSLLRYTMNEHEVHEVLAAEHPDQCFAQLWTRKEALVKWQGTGITTDLKTLLEPLPAAVQLTTTLHNGYACPVATSGLQINE